MEKLVRWDCCAYELYLWFNELYGRVQKSPTIYERAQTLTAGPPLFMHADLTFFLRKESHHITSWLCFRPCGGVLWKKEEYTKAPKKKKKKKHPQNDERNEKKERLCLACAAQLCLALSNIGRRRRGLETGISYPGSMWPEYRGGDSTVWARPEMGLIYPYSSYPPP